MVSLYPPLGCDTPADCLGPRSCIGMSFARAEFACLLAAIVGSFEMEFATPGEKIETEAGITRKLKGDLNLRMKEVVIKAKASH